jgi:hypothetical protein
MAGSSKNYSSFEAPGSHRWAERLELNRSGPRTGPPRPACQMAGR